MFFSVKKWIDRFSEYPNRRQLTKADGTIEQVTVTRDEGTVSKEGDKFNASTMNDLENRISSFDSKISNQFGPTDDASTASAAYTAGSYIIHNGVRYKVTVAIAKGDAFNEGTNISKETVNNQIAELNTKITSLNADLAKLYPVGSIYLSVNDTNPATFIGGTWERLKDVFLLAAGDTYAAGSTGGEATHTLSVDEMPSHRHSSDSYMNGYANSGLAGQGGYCTWVNYGTESNNEPNWGESGPVRTSWVGGSQPHNNMPPYIVVYMWKRVS